jgi:hypothetical protein
VSPGAEGSEATWKRRRCFGRLIRRLFSSHIDDGKTYVLSGRAAKTTTIGWTTGSRQGGYTSFLPLIFHLLRPKHLLGLDRPARRCDRFALGRSQPLGECQGSCRLNYVMIPPIDDAAVLAA